MKIFKRSEAPMRPADTSSFVGPVRTALLGHGEDGAAVHLYCVEFDEAGRTNWHRHSGPQWLLITDGRVRVQLSGGPAEDVLAGDAVLIEPGEKHWHGAAPGHRGSHLAVNVNVTTEWLEPVSEEQYLADTQPHV